jgi:hypothetical protein
MLTFDYHASSAQRLPSESNTGNFDKPISVGSCAAVGHR